jgi:protein-disulfide isomerase
MSVARFHLQKGLLVLAGLASLVAVSSGSGCKSKSEPAQHALRIDTERFKVPVFADDYALGSDTPLVTMVVFTDYACPPCGRTWQVIDNLLEDYGADLRVVYRAHTVSSFARGEEAAEAAFAAGAQARFWEMHRRLFEHPTTLERPALRAHAEALGLDVPRFIDELDTGAHAGIRIRHRREATRLGIRGLPAVFVNGQFLAGYADEATWHGIIDSELERARELIAAGTPRAKLYDAIMERAVAKPVTSPKQVEALDKELAAAKSAASTSVQSPKPDVRYRVPHDDALQLGPEKAPVEVVVFMDYLCPFCRRAWTEELGPLLERHRNDLRIVIHHYPLEIHPAADAAAKAIVAAQRQGAGAEFHQALLAAEIGSLGRSSFATLAKQLHLDDARLLQDLDSSDVRGTVAADLELGEDLGISATPAFFVNGRYASGFSPGRITSMVEEELKEADRLRKAGVPRSKLHAEITAAAVDREAFPNAGSHTEDESANPPP